MTSGIPKLRPDETKGESLRKEKTVRSARRDSFQTGSIKPHRWKNGDRGTRYATGCATLRVEQGGATSERFSEASVTAFRIQRLKSRFTQPDDFVFARRNGSPYDRDWLRESVLYPALETAEIERKPRQHGFHLFRHTCGSIVYALTGDIRLAKDALAQSTTSDIYVHTDEVPAEVAETVGREINFTLTAPQESDLVQ